MRDIGNQFVSHVGALNAFLQCLLEAAPYSKQTVVNGPEERRVSLRLALEITIGQPVGFTRHCLPAILYREGQDRQCSGQKNAVEHCQAGAACQNDQEQAENIEDQRNAHPAGENVLREIHGAFAETLQNPGFSVDIASDAGGEDLPDPEQRNAEKQQDQRIRREQDEAGEHNPRFGTARNCQGHEITMQGKFCEQHGGNSRNDREDPQEQGIGFQTVPGHEGPGSRGFLHLQGHVKQQQELQPKGQDQDRERDRCCQTFIHQQVVEIAAALGRHGRFLRDGVGKCQVFRKVECEIRRDFVGPFDEFSGLVVVDRQGAALQRTAEGPGFLGCKSVTQQGTGALEFAVLELECHGVGVFILGIRFLLGLQGGIFAGDRIMEIGIPGQDIIAIGRVVQHRVLDLLDVRFLEVRTAHIREVRLQPVSRLEREVLQGFHDVACSCRLVIQRIVGTQGTEGPCDAQSCSERNHRDHGQQKLSCSGHVSFLIL